MQGPFSTLFAQLAQQLQLGQLLSLSLANVAGFRCQRGGHCCRHPWKVDTGPEYFERWHAILQDLAGSSEPVLILYAEPLAAQGAYAHVAKRKGTHQCLFQTDDNSCRIHAELGEEALPPTCRSFPRETARAAQYEHSTLSSACTHAAAMLDQQADLLFEILPANQPASPDATTGKLMLSQQRQVSLLEFLPWLGWVLDQIFDVQHSVQTGLLRVIGLLQQAEQNPVASLAELLSTLNAEVSPLLDEGQALELFLSCSPMAEPIHRFLQQRRSQPAPRLQLGAYQRQQRFYRNYLLRRLLNLEALSQWPLTLSQYLWLLAYGLLSQQQLLIYQIASSQPLAGNPAGLNHLVWALNRWEIHGMQNPDWMRELGLMNWNDADCLLGAQQASSFALKAG